MAHSYAQTNTDLPEELNKLLRHSDEKSFKEMVSSYAPEEVSSFNGISVAMAPESRSLQKAKVNFESPRIVYAQAQSKMFLAYASNAKQAEAIVWNPEKSKYEFFILSNFEPGSTNKNLKVTRQDGNTCISCHQNEGPIWSRDPWDEYNPFAFEKRSQKKITPFEGFNSTNAIASPSLIDGVVRRAAKKLQLGNVCKNICGIDDQCKAELLLISLRREPVSDSFIQMLVQKWPKNGFGYASSVLPNINFDQNGDKYATVSKVSLKDLSSFSSRASESDGGYSSDITQIEKQMNPSAENNYELTYEEHSSTLGVDIQSEHTVFMNGVQRTVQYPEIKQRKLKVQLGNESDPLFKRPLVGIIRKQFAADYLKQNLLNCFDFTKIQKGYRTKTKNDEVKKIFVDKLKINPELWNEKIGDLLKDSKDPIKNQNCVECSIPTHTETKPVVSKQLLSRLYDKKEAVKFFTRYCTECHAGTDAVKLLPIDNANKMKRLSKVKKYLESHDMPPDSAELQPSDDERTAILEFLKP